MCLPWGQHARGKLHLIGKVCKYHMEESNQVENLSEDRSTWFGLKGTKQTTILASVLYVVFNYLLHSCNLGWEKKRNLSSEVWVKSKVYSCLLDIQTQFHRNSINDCFICIYWTYKLVYIVNNLWRWFTRI